MWQSDRSLCQDVNVRHSAECWTDHKLLYGKLSLKVQWLWVRKFKGRRYVVALLRDSNNAEVKKLLSEGWMPEDGATSKWCVLRDCVLKAAKSVLGWEASKQPDWFVESYLKLSPLIIETRIVCFKDD